MEEFAEALRSGDPEFVRLYELVTEGIADAIANIITFINPDTVLLTGRVLRTISPDMFSDVRSKVINRLPIIVNNVTLQYMDQKQDETKLASRLVTKHVFEVPIDTLSL